MASFNGTVGIDTFNGNGQNDTFTFEVGELQNVDQVYGGSGNDTLSLFDQGPFVVNSTNLVHVRGIEHIAVNAANVSDVSITLTNAFVASSTFAGQAGVDTVTIDTALGNDLVDLSAVHAGYAIAINTHAGDDTIIGGGADGTYIAEFGNDQFTAGTGIEHFDGNGYFGSQPGNTDHDSVEGTAAGVDGDTYESGDEYLNVGAETIDVTTAGVFAFAMSGFEIVNLADGTNFATIDLLTFERNIAVNGGTGEDTITLHAPVGEDFFGATFGLRLYGNGGDDHLNGLATDDLLYGGAGSDVLIAGNGDNRLYGGALADVLTGGEGDDRLFGGGGDDFMSGGDGADRYIGVNAGDLILEFEGGSFFDVIETGAAKLTMAANIEDLKFTAAHKTDITGNASNNTITVGSNDDKVHAGDGGDRIYGGGGVDRLFGEGDEDFLHGEEGDDVLDGGAGDDWLQGEGGNDTLRGGDGYDIADFSGAQSGLTIEMTNFAGHASAGASTDELESIEFIIGGDFDDTLTGISGAVDFSAGGGFDTIDYSQATDGVDIGGAEHVIGGSGNDVLRGGALMEGNDGDDKIYGGVGAPSTYDGGDGSDTVAYRLAQVPGTTHVDLSNNANNTGAAAGDTLIDIENVEGSDVADDEFFGNENDNILNGHNGDNLMAGYGGNDTLIGGADFDQMEGGDDDDILIGGGSFDFMYGDGGIDLADYSDSNAGVIIDLVNAFGTIFGDGHGGHAEGDVLENIENLIGSNFDDVLGGDDGKSVLIGGDGNDVLDGDAGQDTLTGGTGADAFTWSDDKDSKANNKHDIVTDFSLADGDTIDLSAIDAIKGHQDDAFNLTGSGGEDNFTNDAGELRVFVHQDQTYIQGDVDGNGRADFEIVLTSAIALTEADFVL